MVVCLVEVNKASTLPMLGAVGNVKIVGITKVPRLRGRRSCTQAGTGQGRMWLSTGLKGSGVHRV